MDKLKVLDLFSGIGGFSLGLERTGGFETVAFCEIEKFPQKVLAKHWPDVPIYEDVRNVKSTNTDTTRMEKSGTHKATESSSEEWRAQHGGSRTNGGWVTGTTEDGEDRAVGSIDVITGGFPCQDISVAGKQKGIRDGERSSLFDEIIRLTRDIRPRYVICENVAALLSGSNGQWFSYVLTEFSRIGYDVEWESISAEEVGAWHKRDRVWIIAYPKDNGDLSDSLSYGSHKFRKRNPLYNELRDSKEKKYERNELKHGVRGNSKTVPNTMQPGLQGSENPRSLERSWKKLNKLLAGCSESLGIWSSESSVGRVANGIPIELDVYGELIYEKGDDKKTDTETLRELRWRLLRTMWEQRKTAKTSPDLYGERLHNSLPEVSHTDPHGGWYLGAWIEENKGLCDLWKDFYSKSLEEAQDLQQELLERIRKIERTKEVGPTKDRSNRLKGLGNAVVPQIPELIGRAILEAES